MAWTRSPAQNFTQDERGWPKGKRRKWQSATVKRIRQIHQQLVESPLEFYTGAPAVQKAWRRNFPKALCPPLRTISQIMAELGLSRKRRRDRHKGSARRLGYPEYTIYELFGGRVLEADFVGKKYLAGRTQPLNFLGLSFKKSPKLRYFVRIQGQTAKNFVKEAKTFFRKFEKPEFVKVDNSLALIGSASGKRNLSQAMQFLLAQQVVPIFSVPRKPFSQASIEGNNSVFTRNFWNQLTFHSIEEVDKKLKWFNQSSQTYAGYQPPAPAQAKKCFVPRVYFLRQVRAEESMGKAFVDILNETIWLPQSYIHYFVLAEWNLKAEKLFIYFEKEQKLKLIKRLSFKINPRSKIKCSHFI